MPPVRIFPATDLHFLRGTSVTLRVFNHVNEVWTDLSGAPQGFRMTVFPLPPFIAQAGFTVTATGLGSVVTRLVGQSPLLPTEFASPIRLSVHQQLNRLFLHQLALTLQTSRDDRVITVYGEFRAANGQLVTEDITAHPFLRYDVRVTSGSPVVTVSPEGRVATGDTPGTVEIDISVDPTLNQPAPRITLRVTVVAAITDRPILKRFHTGAAIRKKSILFLPDGFTTNQFAFETLAFDAGRALLKNISPFNRLRESFDLYSAFVPSLESGISVGPPLIAIPGAGAGNRFFPLPMDLSVQEGTLTLQELLFGLGHPTNSPANTIDLARAQMSAVKGVAIGARELPQILFDMWNSLRTKAPQSRLRETFFGLLMGPRHHGTNATSQIVPFLVPNDPDAPAFIHLGHSAVRSLDFDERRLPDLTTNDPETAHLPGMSRFFRTLRVPGENPGLGATWAQPVPDELSTGDNFGLVVIIARADHHGGVLRRGVLLISHGAGMVYQMFPSTNIPRLLEAVAVTRPISAANQKLGFSDQAITSLADTIAHETAHSPALGGLNDEYGGKTEPPDLTDPLAVTFVEHGPNTQLVANVRPGAGPGLNAFQIKWDLERVDGAASVESIRIVEGEIEIAINADDASLWPTVPAGRLLTLRQRNLGGPAPGSTHAGTAPGPARPQSLNLVSFNLANQIIRCRVLGATSPGQVVTTFPAGSVIQIPRLFAGATVRLIMAALHQHLTLHGPLSASVEQVNIVGEVSCQELVRPLPNVPGFRWPANQRRAIAAYDAGASFNCRVIRPTGECKMRTTEPPTDFCFLCKYVIVNAVNPGLLAALDAEYP